ncbi:N-acetyltransferase [Synergistales bacterium]|nr:N-acetyltransferase [Synergistales bacterium]
MVFGTFPVLKTDEFILRELTDDDIFALSSIWASPLITEKLTTGPLSHDQSVQMLYVLRSLWDNDAGIRWGIEMAGRLIGTCGFNNINRSAKRAELGYELDVAFWGHGYMRRALMPVLDYGFNIMRLQRAETFISQDDERSAILLTRLGFVMEGVLRDHSPTPKGFIDEKCFSLIKSDWQAKN